MCGFLAIINSNHNLNERVFKFNKLRTINAHRGPDEINTLHTKKYSIICRRLEIIDLDKRSSQPFKSDDGKIHMAYNGEVYNYLELKKELKNLNIKFKTQSDTEVVLRAYEKWGINFVQKLRGMFSIIIIDNKKNKILCYRDRLGQKPLYYSKSNSGFIISSEIKDILFFKEKHEIKENKKSVEKFLIRNWSDDDKFTFFKGIYSMPAGHIGFVEKSSIKFKQYWQLETRNNIKFRPEEFREKFINNIRIHLRSDVPIAFTLSGGMDSSSILKSSLDLNIPNIKAFSLISNKNKSNFEISYIKDFLNQNNVEHSFCNIDNVYTENILEEITSFQDEPIGETSFLNQYHLRKAINKEGFKVLMVGEGGDEILAGYNRMYIPYLFNIYIRNKIKIPEFVKKNISIKIGKKFNSVDRILKYYPNRLKKLHDIENTSNLKFFYLNEKKLDKKLRFYNSTNPKSKNSFKEFLLNHIFKRDLPYILRNEDRISMSNSIETRSPMVDHKFIEYIFSIDEKYFMEDGKSKSMLNQAMQNKLPNSYFYKPKVGRPGNSNFIVFNVYYKKFLDYLESNFADNELINRKKLIKSIKQDNKHKNYKNSDFYFRALNYLIWKKNFI